MGGVELGKIWLGRKDERAWIIGSVMPAGIFGIWRRCPYKGLRTALFLSAIGWATLSLAWMDPALPAGNRAIALETML